MTVQKHPVHRNHRFKHRVLAYPNQINYVYVQESSEVIFEPSMTAAALTVKSGKKTKQRKGEGSKNMNAYE